MRTYLVKRRNELNLSQQDVANSIGISRQYFNSIETGTRQKKMDITLVAKLATALNLTVENIIHAEENWLKEQSA